MTPVRSQILEILEKMSNLYPDMRFGQLVDNIAMWAKGPTVESIWDVEDEEFLATAKDHVQERLKEPLQVTKTNA